MKTNPRPWLLGATIALLGLTLVVRAEDAAPSAAATSSTAVAPAAEPQPPVPSSAETAPASRADASVPVQAAPAAGPEMAKQAPAPESAAVEPPVEKADTAVKSSAASEEPVFRRSGAGQDRFGLFTNASTGKDESVNTVVAVFGNASARGPVGDSVVAVFGNARAEGPVSDSVVAVIGNVYVDAKVHEVVAVLGNIELGPNAEVYGDVVPIGGVLKRDPKSIVHGDTPTIALPVEFGAPGWLQAYLSQCVQRFRPLAFGPALGWAWGIALGFLAFYAVIALLFGGAIEKCIVTAESRPGGSLLAAVLTMIVTPIVVVLLCITIIGIAAVPFLAIGLMLANLFGRAVMLAWIGTRITRLFGVRNPALGVLVGGAIVLLLYTIPVVGFVTYKLLGFLGLGIVVYTLLRASRRQKQPVAPAIPPEMPSQTVPPMSFDSLLIGAASGTGAAAGVMAAPAVTRAAAAGDAATLPRAGFWIRTAAMLLDVLLMIVVFTTVSVLIHSHIAFPVAALLVAAYAAVLWKMKGTTVGGIICGLRLVRLDNRPIDWATAIVRALGCFISLAGLGLGFIWVAFDDERQSWHDKIAGTTVVHARGNLSLV